MAKSFRFSPVKWRNPEHMPLIQLHLFTNLSPPLISLAFARQLFDFGMIATGNHNFERFVALCNAPGGSQGCFAPGNGGRLRASPTELQKFLTCNNQRTTPPQSEVEPRRLRRSGRQVGDPYVAILLTMRSYILSSCNRRGYWRIFLDKPIKR